jgi:hypothetical protein
MVLAKLTHDQILRQDCTPHSHLHLMGSKGKQTYQPGPLVVGGILGPPKTHHLKRRFEFYELFYDICLLGELGTETEL